MKRYMIILAVLINIILPAQEKQSSATREQAAYAALDAAKSIHGNPVYIGLKSKLIDSLQQYADIYAVKDYIAQFNALCAELNNLIYQVKRKDGKTEVVWGLLNAKQRNIINWARIIAGSQCAGYQLLYILTQAKQDKGFGYADFDSFYINKRIYFFSVDDLFYQSLSTASGDWTDLYKQYFKYRFAGSPF